MGNTKKLGNTGRFGARYGRNIKVRVEKIEKKQRKTHTADDGFTKLKRVSTALYKDTRDGTLYAGGAYTPRTQTGRIVEKMVKQKSFQASMKGLLEESEHHKKHSKEDKGKEE